MHSLSLKTAYPLTLEVMEEIRQAGEILRKEHGDLFSYSVEYNFNKELIRDEITTKIRYDNHEGVFGTFIRNNIANDPFYEKTLREGARNSTLKAIREWINIKKDNNNERDYQDRCRSFRNGSPHSGHVG